VSYGEPDGAGPNLTPVDGLGASTLGGGLVLHAVPGVPLVVPGGAFLLHADFNRSGEDLILIGPGGKEVVIEGYFSSDSPPDLMTAGGAMLNADLVVKLVGPLAPGQYAQAGPAGAVAEAIGKVDTVEGTVEAIRADGTKVTLTKGDAIFQGDTLLTGETGAVGVTFADSTTFSLANNGRMVMDEMVFDPGAQTGTFKMSVVQGVFSFFSGQIAKAAPEGMTISTPVATIGIRGTTVAGNVAAEGEESNISLLPNPDGTVGEITVSNAAGTQVLNTAGATTTVVSFNLPPAAVRILSPEQITQAYSNAINARPEQAPDDTTQQARPEQAPDDTTQQEGQDGDQAALDGVLKSLEESTQELTNLAEEFSNQLSGIEGKIQGLTAQFGSEFGARFGNLFKNLKDVINQILAPIEQAVIEQAIKEVAGEIQPSTTNVTALQAIANLVSTASTQASTAETSAATAVASITSGLSGSTSGVLSSGEASGLGETIAAPLTALGAANAVSAMAGAFLQSVAAALAEASRTGEFDASILAGMQAAATELVTAAAKITQVVTAAIDATQQLATAAVTEAAGINPGLIMLVADATSGTFSATSAVGVTGSVTDNSAVRSATAQVDKVTLGGTVEAGDVFSVTVNGNLVTYTVQTGDSDLDVVRDGLIAAINNNGTVAALATATTGDLDGELRITADSAATALTTTVATTDNGATSNLTITKVTKAQVDQVLIAGTVEAGDTYSVTIGGTTVTYTVTSSDPSLTYVRTGLVNAINNDATLSAIITAQSGAAFTAGNSAAAKFEAVMGASLTAAGSTVTIANLSSIVDASVARLADVATKVGASTTANSPAFAQLLASVSLVTEAAEAADLAATKALSTVRLSDPTEKQAAAQEAKAASDVASAKLTALGDVVKLSELAGDADASFAAILINLAAQVTQTASGISLAQGAITASTQAVSAANDFFDGSAQRAATTGRSAANDAISAANAEIAETDDAATAVADARVTLFDLLVTERIAEIRRDALEDTLEDAQALVAEAQTVINDLLVAEGFVGSAAVDAAAAAAPSDQDLANLKAALDLAEQILAFADAVSDQAQILFDDPNSTDDAVGAAIAAAAAADAQQSVVDGLLATAQNELVEALAAIEASADAQAAAALADGFLVVAKAAAESSLDASLDKLVSDAAAASVLAVAAADAAEAAADAAVAAAQASTPDPSASAEALVLAQEAQAAAQAAATSADTAADRAEATYEDSLSNFPNAASATQQSRLDDSEQARGASDSASQAATKAAAALTVAQTAHGLAVALNPADGSESKAEAQPKDMSSFMMKAKTVSILWLTAWRLTLRPMQCWPAAIRSRRFWMSWRRKGRFKGSISCPMARPARSLWAASRLTLTN
jgi:hypothetical protein